MDSMDGASSTVWLEEGITVKTEQSVIVSVCLSGFQSQDWWWQILGHFGSR